MASAEPDKLKFEHENNDFCRVMFSRKFEGNKFFYCWQEEAKGSFEFYRCSQDGEPSHKVTGWGGVPAKNQTPANPGQTDVGRSLNAFLKL